MSQIIVGKIRTSHGVKGDLKVFSSSGDYDHYSNFETVVLKKGNRSKSFEVEAVKGSGASTLLKLKGIDSPEEGKLYAGYDILVDEGLKAPCYEGEYYQSDLIGCDLVYQGETLATVLDMVYGGPNDLLEVKKSDNDVVVLVPFRNEFVGDVDIINKKIELRVDWILD
ncbi:16S rRNA processing protein RimM [Thiospirochaeta perfilievii]|uniref:Ribosome maturation factor RimM n=1 Tax=Thiospirochaeta perfilievii TaxID=252967 RepID=A0A5C1Q8L2_9SPIO|nr:ribosome maturation factor RimM [Thiospirochaeta perfilievii]QEN03831.1 16S rRNA processing protein RimM [Thiospirochaeta perfilievii]